MARRPALDLAELEASIGYTFADRELLTRALTHISALPGTPSNGPHYQRLEFLGDRVLGIVIADMLFRTFPSEDEGDLSRRLADLVRKESCAEIAEQWGVSPYIRLGTGEKLSGMRKKSALLGDVCEAVIASVYLDGGFDAARLLIERSFGPRLSASKRSRRHVHQDGGGQGGVGKIQGGEAGAQEKARGVSGEAVDRQEVDRQEVDFSSDGPTRRQIWPCHPQNCGRCKTLHG